MSLINQMLKDLEKRRSRDLETSDSLSQNITWETPRNQNPFNWLNISIVFTLVVLVTVIGYLLWKVTIQNAELSSSKKVQQAFIKKTKAKKKPVKNKTKVKKQIKPLAVAENSQAEVIERNGAIAAEEINRSPPTKLKKKHRPLSNKQRAEIAYKKAYTLLQQGRMHQGKEYLHEALSHFNLHIKSREMLAGIYIKSGQFINAAELLNEGIRVVPDYPLFAKLYARVLLEQDNPQRAITILEQGSGFVAMDIEPDYFALLAATYQRVKKHEKAVDIYLQLVKIRPAAGVWWLGLAISLEKRGKNNAALEAYQRAQKTGSLKAGLVKFTHNRVAALKEIGFPDRY